MVNCDFCGIEITPGTGKLYIRKDGTQFRFCSSKCQKNQLLKGYKARITPWTAQARAIKAGKKQ